MRYLIILFCLLEALSGYAQDGGDSKLWYGLKVNGNLATRKKLPDDSLECIVKPGAGLFAAYNIRPWLRPQLEIEYSSLSYRKLTEETVNKAFLDIGFQLYLKPGKNTNINICLGGQASISQGINHRRLNGSSGNGLSRSYDKSENGRVDYLVSAGLTFPASNKVDIHTRYYYSLTGKEVNYQVIGKSSFFQFGIAVNINKFLDETLQPSEEDKLREKENRTLMEGGVLLVRLNYPLNALKRLELQGAQQQADSLKRVYDVSNKQLIQAFKKYYSFTPIYFFIDKDSYKVLKEDFDSLFVNDSLVYDTSVKMQGSRFLIAEIGYMQPYYGSAYEDMMVVLNSRFQQMKSPFPYSLNNLKAFEGTRKFFKDINPDSMNSQERNVYILNQRLIKFYSETYGYHKK